MAKVCDLIIYPIKGLPGASMKQVEVEKMGLKDDRRMMLVDEEGVFISQRTCSELLLFKTHYNDGELEIQYNHEHLTINSIDENRERMVSVWDHHVKAKVYHLFVNEWFSDHLKMKVTLVQIPGPSSRIKTFDKDPGSTPVSFADGYPILVIGTASLNDLNQRLDDPIGMNRFRGNIIVDTKLPFEEDDFAAFRLGSADLNTIKPCARCQVIGIDPASRKQGKEPLKTLSTYRKKGGKVYFGSNVMVQSEGLISIGDEVVLK